jgi:hypothetical protein
MRGRTAASKRPGSLEVSMIAHRSLDCPDNRPVIVPVQSLHSWPVVPCEMGARRRKSVIVRLGLLSEEHMQQRRSPPRPEAELRLARHTTGPQSLLSGLVAIRAAILHGFRQSREMITQDHAHHILKPRPSSTRVLHTNSTDLGPAPR